MNGLNWLPGPLIKWFLKKMSLEEVFQIAKRAKNLKAEEKTIIGFSPKKEEIYFFEGKIKGKIVPQRGKNGFVWDKIFQPKDSNKTFAEMSPKEKNEISMRKKTIEK